MAAVGGLDPSVLVAPDYQVQLERAQRTRALAAALQQQALADTPGNGGSVSWTQGLARIADALVAGSANRRADKMQIGANQAYAAGMARLFGMPSPQGAQTAQGAPPPAQGAAMPPMPPQAPQQAQAQPSAPFVPGAPVPSGQADPLAVQPDAPPQAAPQPPMQAPQQQASGGAPSQGPMNLTGDPRRDMGLYVMNPEEYGKAMIGNAAKGSAPLDPELMIAHARDALNRGDMATAQAIFGALQKSNYIAPTTGRPGGWTIYADGHKEFNPQAPAPGAMPIIGANGQPTGAWSEDPSAAGIQAHQAGAVAGAQAGAKAPYEFQGTFENGQPGVRSVADLAGQGGGSLNGHYYGQSGSGHQAPGNGFIPTGPSLGASSAADAYGKGNAQAFLDTQGIAKESPQRVQALREMQGLVANGLPTGPTAAKFQQMAEEHGLTFLAKDNAFVFNKDAARFVAQSASDLGLNGSDARLGMMANASPNMKMTPAALKVVIPTMIGLEYAKMAKATAASSWAGRDPAGNAKFESTWRQNYDPRMFTAYAQGGPKALASAPANVRQQWLKDYRALKGMGVDFTQFAQ